MSSVPGVNAAPSARIRADEAAPRVVAIDVLRGLVLLVLLPDLAGGFSFYRMAQTHPGDWLWGPLSSQFGHVEWSGMALWDLVMPLFVFLIGVSMALSAGRRQREGQSPRAMLAQAVLRSATLVVLGLLLQFKVESHFDELLPFIVLSAGLPAGAWLGRLAGHPDIATSQAIDVSYRVGVLAAAIGWMTAHLGQLGNYQFGNQILVLAGLAYTPAFMLNRCSVRAQVGAVAAILAAYGLAFMLYNAPADAVPLGTSYTGLFGHWNNGTNLAAAFDRWLFEWLPREEPYAGNPHGYHTLEFIPLIAVMVAGAMTGRALVQGAAPRPLALRCAVLAAAGLALAWVLAETLFPLVKSLWTPSWTVFSVSACLALLASVLYICDRHPPSRFARALIVLGANSVVLYVVSFTERWRIVSMWRRVAGEALFSSLAWSPVLEAALVLLTLWGVGFALWRLRIFVRI